MKYLEILQNNVTQAQLALIMGRSVATACRTIHGKRRPTDEEKTFLVRSIRGLKYQDFFE